MVCEHLAAAAQQLLHLLLVCLRSERGNTQDSKTGVQPKMGRIEAGDGLGMQFWLWIAYLRAHSSCSTSFANIAMPCCSLKTDLTVFLSAKRRCFAAVLIIHSTTKLTVLTAPTSQITHL